MLLILPTVEPIGNIDETTCVVFKKAGRDHCQDKHVFYYDDYELAI